MVSTDRLEKGLEKFFGLKEFRPGQIEIIHSVMNGFDSLVVMPTGGGKSICYQLPAMLLDGLTIVITPLISLMKDQVAQINRNGLIATQLDSTLELDEMHTRMQLVRAGKVKLLYVAPERLEAKKFVDSLSQVRVSLLAVDEAHCVSQWGHDFRPHYMRIPEFSEKIGNPTILALTATATPEVQDDIIAQLRMREPRVYVRGFNRDNLSFQVSVETNKTQTILNHAERQTGSGIIYTATRKSVDELHEFLVSRKIPALRYHAGLSESERATSQDAFLRSDRVMVATNAFGMGINKPNVRFVIHYEIPGTLEAYYQEAGRAGRDGRSAECILLYHKRDVSIQEYFIKTLYPEGEEIFKAYAGLFDSLSMPVGVKAEEYLTASIHQIAETTKLPARIISSVLRIMTQANLIKIMPSISGNAYVQSKLDMPGYRRAMDRTSSSDSHAVLDALLRVHGNSMFSARQPISLIDLAGKTELPVSSVSRTLSILTRSGILEYKPPTEGVSFRMLAPRYEISRLPINVSQIEKLREKAKGRLSLMVEYARATSCRTDFVLRYFGARETENGCGNCDNCTISHAYFTESAVGDSFRNPQEIYSKVLALVSKTHGKFGRTTYCRMLLDKADAKKLHSDLQIEFGGIFSVIPAQVVYSAFDYLLARNYLSKIGTFRPTVSITEDGESFLVNGFSKPTREIRIFREGLHKALRDERKLLAAEFRVPVFLICTDANLARIANERPVELGTIYSCVPGNTIYSAATAERLLQVCLDHSPVQGHDLSESERRIYELFLEGPTAVEIAEALSVSLQEVIETLERLGEMGLKIDLAKLIDRKKFARIKSELIGGKDFAEARRNAGDCELSEVILVSKLIGSAASG